jgi:hypothetical protein
MVHRWQGAKGTGEVMGTPVQAGEPEAGEPELVALAKIAGQERADLPPDGIPVSLLQDLMEHISCDRISVTGMDSTHQSAWFRQALVHGGEPEPPDPPAVARALSRTAAVTRAFPPAGRGLAA